MPKIKTAKAVLLQDWIKDDSTLSTNGKVVYCQVCSKHVASDKKFSIDQHKDTQMHKKNKVRNINSSKKQTFVNELPPQNQDSQFKRDFCEALVCANIPIYKVENVKFRSFLEKWTDQTVPSQSTLRKSYVDKIYTEKIDQIRQNLKDEYLWFSVDETTNCRGEYVANLILGALSEEKITYYLVRSKVLEKTNFDTIIRFVNDSFQFLFPGNLEIRDKIILMVTDGAAYMVKAGQTLKLLYPFLIHLTCLAHGLNLIAECVRTCYPLVNSLISSGKKVFLKAPLRTAAFKDSNPDIPLPPEPVLTRWGTWLHAVEYYARNYIAFKNTVTNFVSDAVCVVECQQLLKKPELEAQLQFINAHFVFLSKSITLLEEQGLQLNTSLDIIKEVQLKLDSLPHSLVTNKVREKFYSVINKNPGYNTIQNICRVLSGEEEGITTIAENYKKNISKFKYAPITSCDVERSFSRYKNILSDKRHSLSNENLEKYIVCYCNASEDV